MKKQSYLILILTLSSLAILRGQPITVETLVAPPFAANISDYLEQSVLKITNSSNAPISIMLKGTLASDNGINGRTKDTYKPSRPIVVPPNNAPIIIQATKQNGADFFDNKNIDYNTGAYSLTDIARTGVIPEGNYTLCITAHDYVTGELKSKTDNGFNCKIFNIIFPQPPMVDCDGNAPMLNGVQSLAVGAAAIGGAPQAPVSIRFSWLPTNANGRALVVAYDLYLLKLIDGQNGQDALLASIRNRQNNAIKFENIRTPQYNAILAVTPSLVVGKYAWAVVAKDGGGGQTAFQNNGISQVCEFEWTKPAVVNPPPPPPPRVAITEPNCDCKLLPPVGDASIEELKVGDFVKLGAYTLRVNSAQRDPSGGWKGTGNIRLPIIGVKLIPILVDFVKLTFSKSGGNKEAQTGVATAQKHAGSPSIQPHVVIPEKPTLLPVKTSDLTDYDDYFNRNRDHLLSNMQESAANSGIQLPFGIDARDLPTVALVNMTFTPQKAWFDAIAGMEITEEEGKWLAFGASGVCMRTGDGEGICGDVQLYLAEDLELGTKNLRLLGAKGQDLKNACHLVIKNSKVEDAVLVGEYAFPRKYLKHIDNRPEDVKVTLNFHAKSWSNWVATVEMPDFKITGAEDFKFKPKIAYYDHTDLSNPKDFPNDYTEGVAKPLWQGFFFPDLEVELPPVLKKNDKSPTIINIKNLIVDKDGVSVKIIASDIINIRSGNLDGWAFSLDNIDVEILKSTFKNGKLNGKLLLPITEGEQSEIDYKALLSYRNDELKYNFNIQPKANMTIPMWAAHMDINQNSQITISNENVKAEFHAEAHLYGSISISTKDINKKLPKFDLAGLKFENLYIKNYKDDKDAKDDYIGVKSTDFVSGFASPQKFGGGFPLSITSFAWSPIQGAANAAFKVGFKMNLSDLSLLPEASGELLLRGNVARNQYGLLTPQYIGIEVTKIEVKGEIGPVHVDGRLDFFNDDDTYGNGIYGRLSATMLNKDIEIANATVQFGSKSGRPYWFVDIAAENLDKLLPGTKIYALNGGAYYNMKLENMPKSGENRAKNNSVALGSTLSGIKYTPQFDGVLGFKGFAYFGIVKKEVFNADADMTIEFDGDSKGVKRFAFLGSGRYLQAEGAEPVASGGLKVDYDHKNKIFACSLGIQMTKPIAISGNLNIYFSPQGWHIKLGQPKSVGNPVSFELIPKLVTVDAYLQVGNYDVDVTPDLPKAITDRLWAAGINPDDFKVKRPAYNAVNLAIAFGAGFSSHNKGTFGPLYGELSLDMGFDISLQNLGECNGKTVGIGGWYANGQIYAGMYAAIGIHVDLGFFNTNVKILDCGVGVVIQGGGPNPFWGKGALGIDVNVLGIIKGKVHYQFKIGEPCDPTLAEGGLATVKIISDVRPADNATNVELDQALAVAFNYEIDKVFSLDEFKEGVKKTRYFKLERQGISTTLKNRNLTREFPNGENLIVLRPNNLLEPNTKYELTIKVSLKESPDGNDKWDFAKDKNNQPFKEEKTYTFTTNNGLRKINPENIANYNPIARQRYFIRNNEVGFVETNNAYEVDKFDVPHNRNPRPFVRFAKLDGKSDAANALESPVRINGKRWEFDLPDLEPNQVYVALYVIRWELTAQEAMRGGNLKARTRNTNINKDVVEISEKDINNDKLQSQKGELLVYQLPFRTSRFSTYAAKLEAFKFREMVFALNYNKETALRLWLMDEQKTVVDNIANRLKTAFNLPNNSRIDPVEYNFWLNESFDDSDVKGVTIKTPTTNFTIPPRIAFTNETFKTWTDNYYRSIQEALKAGGLATGIYISTGKGSDFGMEIAALEDIYTYTTPMLSNEEVIGLPYSNFGLSDPNNQTGVYYSDWYDGNRPRALLGIRYALTKPNINIGIVNNTFGKFQWSVNPSSNGFSAMGNAFNAGMNAMQSNVGGVNMNANIGGVNKNLNVMAR